MEEKWFCVSYLCEAVREELHVLSWSVSVFSKLDVFFILIVFFCKKNETVSHQIFIWDLQCAMKIDNLSLWEAFHEGAPCALVATGICIICRVWPIIHFTLTAVEKTLCSERFPIWRWKWRHLSCYISRDMLEVLRTFGENCYFISLWDCTRKTVWRRWTFPWNSL